MSGIADQHLASRASNTKTALEDRSRSGVVSQHLPFPIAPINPLLLVLMPALIAFQAVLFWPVTGEFFSPDDVFYLAQPVSSWSEVQRVFTELDKVANYRPLTYLVATGLHSIWKLDPFPYHVFTLFGHIGITVLVFWLARLLLVSDLAAFATAAFFGLHSSASRVAFGITFISDLLYAAFFIFSIIAFLKFEQGCGKHWMPLSLSSFVLSLFSKEPAVTLPALLMATVILVPAVSTRISPISSMRATLKRTGPFWAIGFLYLSWFALLTHGRFVPQNPEHPYYVSLSWETLHSKFQYLGLALNLGRFDTIAGHPTVAKFATQLLPPAWTASFMRTSDFWLYVAGPVWMIWLAVQGNWQGLREVAVYAISTPLLAVSALMLIRMFFRLRPKSERNMITYGVLFFLLPLCPVLILPADKTMLHNLYVPAIGLGIVLGVSLRNCSLRGLGGVEAFVSIGLLALVLVMGVHYVPLSIQTGWPTATSRAANKYLEDVQRFEPTLPKGAILYFERTGMPEWPFLTAVGDLFRVFYRDQTLVTVFGDFGESIPMAARFEHGVFKFREINGRLIPVDN